MDRLRWAVRAAVFGALIYLGGSIWAGFDDMSGLRPVPVVAILPLIALTLSNYLLRSKGTTNGPAEGPDEVGRTSGTTWRVAMVISPAKAGELLKPYVVRARTGVPMATTIPALVSERLTDAIAMLALAGISVTTYAADQVHYVIAPLLLVGVGLAVLAHKGLSMAILGVLGKLPVVGRVAPKLEEMYSATRVCLAPVPFAISMALSFAAWFAECVAYYLVLYGLQIDASPTSACSSTPRAPSCAPAPGGLGVSDGALAVFATTLIGVEEGKAVASALITRVVTLWLGVLVGAVALLAWMLGGAIDLDQSPDAG